MQPHYRLLQTIYQIVKNDARPLSYQVGSRELILYSHQDWTEIESALEVLKEEELVTTRHTNILLISVTERGMEVAKGLSAVEQ